MLGSVWKRWNWLEEGLVPLAAILMYATWMYPLFAMFIRDSAPDSAAGFSFVLCLGILIGGTVVGRLAAENRMGVVIVVVGGIAAVLIALLLAIPAAVQDLDLWATDIVDQAIHGRGDRVIPVPLMVGLSTILLWWRGVRIATAEYQETRGVFAVGVVALAGLLLLAFVSPAGSPRIPGLLASMAGPLAFLASIPIAVALALSVRALGAQAAVWSQAALAVGLLSLGLVLPAGPPLAFVARWVLPFLITSLVALALHGALDVLREQEHRIGIHLPIDRHWIVTMLGVIGGILLVGLLLSQALAPRAIAEVLGWIRPVWRFLIRVVLFVIFVLAYLFFSLVEPLLAEILNRPPQAVPEPWNSPLTQQDVLKDLTEGSVAIPPIFDRMLQVILLLGVIALVGWILILAAQRRRRVSTLLGQVVETRETILSLDLVRDQLRSLLAGLGKPKALPLFLDPGLAGDPRRAIRMMYQEILARGIQLGVSRARKETPRAYAQKLLILCPNEKASMETLTSAYEAVRYGTTPPTPEHVQAAREAFLCLDAALARHSDCTVRNPEMNKIQA
jgi:hypothetical protein